MDPKIAKRLEREAAKATVEGLAKVKETLERLEKKIDALARMIKAKE